MELKHNKNNIYSPRKSLEMCTYLVNNFQSVKTEYRVLYVNTNDSH